MSAGYIAGERAVLAAFSSSCFSALLVSFSNAPPKGSFDALFRRKLPRRRSPWSLRSLSRMPTSSFMLFGAALSLSLADWG